MTAREPLGKRSRSSEHDEQRYPPSRYRVSLADGESDTCGVSRRRSQAGRPRCLARRKGLVSLALAWLLLSPNRIEPARACGDPGPLFHPVVDPAVALRTFAAGDVGVISPHWDRRYLLLAWRHLAGPSLDAEEHAALERDSEEVANRTLRDAVDRWSDVRMRVTGTGLDSTYIDERALPEVYSYYPNCLADAFIYAAATLEARIATWGVAAADTNAWVTGQDAVFSNCSRGQATPPPLRDDASPLLVRDHAYQKASAWFYAERPREATAAFDIIAADHDSPHRLWAPYLAARADLRTYTLLSDPEGLVRAQIRVDAVLADPSLLPTHAAARRLKDLLLFRQQPQRQLDSLTQRVLAGAGSELSRLLRDWERLAYVVPLPIDSPALAWVLAVKGEQPDPYAFARSRFEAGDGRLWLVPTLIHAAPDSPELDRLLAEVSKVSPADRDALTLYLHAIRLHLERRETALAQDLFDRVDVAALGPATANAFHAAGLALARNLRQWAEHAARVKYDPGNGPVAFELHADARLELREQFPVSVLIVLARDPQIPPEVRRSIALQGFVRAIMLDDHAHGRAFATLIGGSDVVFDADLDAYRHALGKARGGLGALLVFKHEHVFEEPSIREEFAEFAQPCSDARCWVRTPAYTGVVNIGEWPTRVLSAAQSRARRAELAKLGPLGIRLNVLGDRVLAWSGADPQHPRVPETLYRLVAQTRRASVGGVSDEHTGRVSRRAFMQLHERYPDNEFTQRTPYWFR